MVVVIKTFVACFLLLFASACVAEETPFFDENTGEETLNFAQKKMEAAINALDSKVKECEEIAKTTDLDLALFQSFPLTDKELKTALLHLNRMAQTLCEGEALWGNAVIALSQFKFIEKHYKGKNTRETRYDLETLCCAAWRTYFEVELAYMELDPKIRRKLEQMPQLQKPFYWKSILDIDKK